MATLSKIGTEIVSSVGSGARSTASITPTLNDLIVIVVYNSNTSGTPAVPGTEPTDNNSDGLGTYTLAETCLLSTSGQFLEVYIRDALIGSATGTIFTNNNSLNTGGGLAVFAVSGMTKTGSTAKRQSAKQDSQSSSTPAPAFSGAALTTNPIISAIVGNTNVAPARTPRSGFTSLVDDGYSTPSTGIQIIGTSSGETGSTMTWGSATTFTYGSLAVELDASSSGSVAPIVAYYQSMQD